MKKRRLSLEMALPVRERLERLKVETRAASLVAVVCRALEVYQAVVDADGEFSAVFPDGAEKKYKVLV